MRENIVLYGALAANVGIAIAKFVAAGISGSSSMLTEGVHSLVDSGNQLLLLYGQRQARKGPDHAHPFGYGRELYFWAFIVAILIFALGAGVSIYEGFVHIREPEPLRDPTINYVVLDVALLLEGASWTIAVREFDAKRGDTPWWTAVRRSKDPAGFIVLFEDSAACAGLVVAALGQAEACAARAVVEPQLARAQRAAGRKVLPRDQVPAIGGPDSVVEQAEVLLGDLLGVGAVGRHRPDVVAARAVGREREARAVGREARLEVERGAGREAPRGAALDGQQVQVAQQVEHDRPPVGAHVEVHPRPLGGGEADGFRGAVGRGHVPGVRHLGGGVGRRSGGGLEGRVLRRGAEREDEREREKAEHGRSGREDGSARNHRRAGRGGPSCLLRRRNAEAGSLAFGDRPT